MQLGGGQGVVSAGFVYVACGSGGVVVVRQQCLKTLVERTPAPPAPCADDLGQNHPNPFNPRTAIPLILQEDGAVELRIYDAAGKLVRTLVDGQRRAGRHQVAWTGRSESGRALPSGLYLVRLRTARGDEIRGMILLE